MNYFKLFNLEFSYSVDLDKLTSNYYNLQKKYHPDLVNNKLKIKYKEKYERFSTTLNIAYQTLLDPLLRAKYILEINHISNSFFLENDFNFLKKIFFLEEKIRFFDSSIFDRKVFDEVLNDINNMFSLYLKKIEIALNKKLWELSSKILSKLFFLENLKKKINKLEEKNFWLN